MAQRWAISDPRWDSRLSLRLLRLGFLGVWSTLVSVGAVNVIHDGTLNGGAITRVGTPCTFWFIVCVALAAAAATLVYNLYLFLRRRRTPETA